MTDEVLKEAQGLKCEIECLVDLKNSFITAFPRVVGNNGIIVNSTSLSIEALELWKNTNITLLEQLIVQKSEEFKAL